jgi:heme exporter protein B
MIKKILNTEILRLQLIRDAWLIFQKDVRQEFKTRYALNAILLFALVTLVAVSFSIGVFNAGSEIKSALLWVIIYFSAMSGLSHIFVREEEKHTADKLKLVTQPTAIFLGKFIFNLFLLYVLEIITIPLYFAVMNFGVKGIITFLCVLFLGSFGLSAGATMIAAIISKASAKGALFAVLSFPILLPVIITGINGTKTAVNYVAIVEASGDLQMLFAYAVVVLTAAILLFDFVWNE